MPGPFDPGPPRWDPTMEVFPGGPHPGAVHQMHEERARAEEEQRIVFEIAVKRRRDHLLLLRK